MTICLVLENPNESVAQFEQVMTHLSESGPMPPEGLIFFAAGPANGGLRAISVWNSRQDMERFFTDRLGAAYAAAELSDEAVVCSTFDVHLHFAGGARVLAGVVPPTVAPASA